MNRSELFRLGKSGKLSMKRISMYGITKKDLDDKIAKGVKLSSWEERSLKTGSYDNFRKVTKVSGNDLYLEGSAFSIQPASLLDFVDNTIVQYYPGEREMNEEEKKVMDEWASISSTEDYKKQATIDIMTDSSTTYWRQKAFFQSKSMEHLFLETVRGCRISNTSFAEDGYNLIIDNKVKGKVASVYEYKID